MTAQAPIPKLSQRERELLRSLSGGAELRLLIRSGTRVDTGRWWWSTHLWLGVLGDELLLWAASRRAYTQRVELSECRLTRYHPMTGELVLAPGKSLRFNRVMLPPEQALRVLRLIHESVHSTGESSANVTENLHA